MRIDRLNYKVADEALLKLLTGKEISDKERLNLLKAYSLAAKSQNKTVWHFANNMIDRYEYIVDMKAIDKILIKWATKIDFAELDPEKNRAF